MDISSIDIAPIGRIAAFDSDGLTYGDLFSFVEENKLYRVIDIIGDNTVMYVAHGDEIEKDGEWCRDYTKTAHFQNYNSNKHIVNYGNIKFGHN